MLSEYHDLAHELPEYKDQIHELKTQDGHFNKLFKQYDGLVKEILRIEKQVEAASDERLEDLKRQRLKIKDAMVEMLAKAA